MEFDLIKEYKLSTEPGNCPDERVVTVKRININILPFITLRLFIIDYNWQGLDAGQD